MYQLTAPVTQRQLKLTQEYDRLERYVARTGMLSPAQSRRRAAILREIAEIEEEKQAKRAA